MINYRRLCEFQAGANDTFPAEIGDALDWFLKSRGIIGGISMRFSGLNQVSAYYDQAVNVVSLYDYLDISRSYILVQDYKFFDLLLSIADKKDLRSYISDKVRVLMHRFEKQ